MTNHRATRDAYQLTESGLAALGDHTPRRLRAAAICVRPDHGEDRHAMVDAAALADLLELAAYAWPRLPRPVRGALAALAGVEATP